jgi:hypothetical protein
VRARKNVSPGCTPRSVCADRRYPPGTTLARALLEVGGMAMRIEPWTIPLLVVLWTTLLVGLIMTIVVVMMR